MLEASPSLAYRTSRVACFVGVKRSTVLVTEQSQLAFGELHIPTQVDSYPIITEAVVPNDCNDGARLAFKRFAWTIGTTNLYALIYFKSCCFHLDLRFRQ